MRASGWWRVESAFELVVAVSARLLVCGALSPSDRWLRARVASAGSSGDWRAAFFFYWAGVVSAAAPNPPARWADCDSGSAFDRFAKLWVWDG
jgi:hypothetical protein